MELPPSPRIHSDCVSDLGATHNAQGNPRDVNEDWSGEVCVAGDSPRRPLATAGLLLGPAPETAEPCTVGPPDHWWLFLGGRRQPIWPPFKSFQQLQELSPPTLHHPHGQPCFQAVIKEKINITGDIAGCDTSCSVSEAVNVMDDPL